VDEMNNDSPMQIICMPRLEIVAGAGTSFENNVRRFAQDIVYLSNSKAQKKKL
jgi:hypothetical protein